MPIGPVDLKREAERFLRSFSEERLARYLERLERGGESRIESYYLDQGEHCGVFVQVGSSRARISILRQMERLGVKVLPLGEALERVPEARDSCWRLVDYRESFYTALVAAYGNNAGLFVHVPRDVRITIPLMSCFLLPESNRVQLIHNVIILEPGAELCIVKGCMAVPRAENVAHISVEEVYVGPGARLHVVMLHSWNRTSEVRSLTVAKLEQDSMLNTLYFTHTPVKESEVVTKAALERNAQATLSTVVVGRGEGKYLIRDEAKLVGDSSSAMIVSRAAAFERCEIDSVSRIEAYSRGSRGHIECTAVPFSDAAKIKTTPELAAFTEDVQLSHEAAIGKLSEEELTYLMLKGLSEEEAKSLLVLGLLRVEMPSMPDSIKALVDRTVREVFKRVSM